MEVYTISKIPSYFKMFVFIKAPEFGSLWLIPIWRGAVVVEQRSVRDQKGFPS